MDVSVHIKKSWIKKFHNLNSKPMRNMLSEYKEVINITDISGFTALIYASFKGAFYTVKMLIDNGADVNFKDKNGCTALMWAFIRSHPRVVNILIEAGGNIFLEDKEQRTCLHHALHENKIELVNYLYNQGLVFGTEKHERYKEINEETHNYFQDYEGYREYRMINEEK